MRRIVSWLAATVVGLVLLFSYRTSTVGAPASASASASSRRAVVMAAAKLRLARDQTVDGPVAQTRWGPVQVSIRVVGGRLADVRVLQQPSDNGRDVEINGFALPVLHREAIAAQSARIDTVGGASYTSDGYRQSLQGAMDRLVAGAAPSAPTSTGATAAAGARGATGTFPGPVVDTRWGPVQVAAVLRAGVLRDVRVLEVPQDNSRDQEINGFAIPILHDEAIAAQSARIDAVGGASYTSDGYRRSLQAALDRARG